MPDSELEAMSDEELLALGVELFNSQRFFDAHEAWEELWLRAGQPERHFYQGLIQIAAGFVHLQRNEYPGTVRLLQEGVSKLERYPASHHGLLLKPLLDGTIESRRKVVALGERRLAEFDLSALPKISSEP